MLKCYVFGGTQAGSRWQAVLSKADDSPVEHKRVILPAEKRLNLTSECDVGLETKFRGGVKQR